MSKHLNPLEKEFLIRQYKSNPRTKMSEFCEANHIFAAQRDGFLREGELEDVTIQKLVE